MSIDPSKRPTDEFKGQGREQSRRERYLKALETVRDISSRAAVTDGFDSFLNYSLARIAELVAADSGMIYLLDPGSGKARLAASHNLPESLWPALDSVNTGEYCLGKSLLAGTNFSSPDLKHVPSANPELMGAGCRSVIIVPLKIMEPGQPVRVLGAILMAWKSIAAYDDEALKLMEAVGSQLALVMENLRLSLEREQTLADLKRTVLSVFDYIRRTSAGILILTGTKISFGNPAAFSMLGEEKEVIGRDVMEFILSEDRESARELLQKHLQRKDAPHEFEARIARPHDGKRLILNVLIYEIQTEGGSPVLVLNFRDVTERVKYEWKLKASENKHRLLVEMGYQGIISIDAAGSVTFANRRAGEILGREPGDLIGRNVLELVEEHWRPVARELFLSGRETPVEQEEINLELKDGSALECMINSGPIFDEHNLYQGQTIFINDFSETKKMREHLYDMDKMSAIGRLAAGVAHEFNNINAAIQGYAELLLKEKHLTPQDREDLGAIRELIRRSSHITQQLLTFARREVIQKETCDLAALVDVNVKIVRKEYETEGISLSARHTAKLPLLKLDAGRIGQVLIQLIMNARDAVLERGEEKRIEIETGMEDAWAYLRVRDTGGGISAEDQKRIFEPFFTTKGALGGSLVPGTGLGLSVAHSIVKEHGGVIEVQSSPGQGAVFTIRLPLAGEETPSRTRKTAHGPVAVGARILIVDDELNIVRMLERALKTGGYQVETALSAKEGLKKIQDGGHDVVLVDLQMPDLNGIELLAEAARLPARLRPASIIISGKARVGELKDYEHLGVEAIVKKPFALETIFQAIYDSCLKRQAQA
jgi:PAS domain S-box-containing protein